jgi:hypothetical protein
MSDDTGEIPLHHAPRHATAFAGVKQVSDIQNADGGVLAGYLTPQELAAELRVTIRSLQLWESKRIGPPVTRLGKHPLYRRDAVAAWIVSCEMPMVRAGSAKRRRRATAPLVAA